MNRHESRLSDTTSIGGVSMLLDPRAKWDMAPDEEYFMDMYSHRRSISPSSHGMDDNIRAAPDSLDASPREYLTAITDSQKNVTVSISHHTNGGISHVGGGSVEMSRIPATFGHETIPITRKPVPVSMGKFTKTSNSKKRSGLLANRSRNKGKSYDLNSSASEGEKIGRGSSSEQKNAIIKAPRGFGDSSPEVGKNSRVISPSLVVNSKESLYDVIGPPSGTALNGHRLTVKDNEDNDRLSGVSDPAVYPARGGAGILSHNMNGEAVVGSVSNVHAHGDATNNDNVTKTASDSVLLAPLPYLGTAETILTPSINASRIASVLRIESHSTSVKKRNAPPPPIPKTDFQTKSPGVNLMSTADNASVTKSDFFTEVASPTLEDSSSKKGPAPPLPIAVSAKIVPVKTLESNSSFSLTENTESSPFRPVTPKEFQLDTSDEDLMVTRKRELEEQPSFLSSSYRKFQQTKLSTTLGLGSSRPPIPVKLVAHQNSINGFVNSRPKSHVMSPLAATDKKEPVSGMVHSGYTRAYVGTTNSVVKDKQFKTRLELLMNARSNSASTSAMSSLSRNAKPKKKKVPTATLR